MNFLSGGEAEKHDAHTIGIRPEHLSIVSGDGAWVWHSRRFRASRADTFFHVRCEDLRTTLTVRADGDNPLQYGDSVSLQRKPANCTASTRTECAFREMASADVTVRSEKPDCEAPRTPSMTSALGHTVTPRAIRTV